MLKFDIRKVSERIDVNKTRELKEGLKLVLKYVSKTCFEHIFFVFKK